MKHTLVRPAASLFIAFLLAHTLAAQQSVARVWNEALLKTIQEDLAQPNVQARNIFHFSVALYDAWAAYDNEASPYLLGKTVDGYTCPFNGVPKPADVEAARQEAISFAVYRLMTARFTHSPQGTGAVLRFREIMKTHGYDFRNYAIDYTAGSPAALGNYVAQCILQMAGQDGANEANNYMDHHYQPLNQQPLEVVSPGPGKVVDPNRWQPLKLNRAIDQDGYPMLECRCGGKPLIALIDSVDKRGRHITATQTFQGSDWSQVKPFALGKQNQKVYRRNEHDYRLYYDPGADFLPRLDTLKGGGTSKEYMWNYSLVAAWSALLDPNDPAQWDASPRGMGNVQSYPKNMAELHNFYDLKTGRDPGKGYALNPRTGQPYTSRMVPRGDYIRAAVQYWAEGPDAETPPGHWLSSRHR